MITKNNLFQFATSELSQDAMICWVCNNYNFRTDNGKLFELADKIIHDFLDDPEVKINSKVRIIQQFHKIDVLLIVNDQYGIIIEDKTYTSEHGNQIYKYKQELLNNISDYERENYNLPNFKEEDIKTVYLKTGFFYPDDVAIKADLKITGWDWYNKLIDYKDESLILDDYLTKLKNDLKWYEEVENLYKSGNVENVLNKYYGQYLLINDMFAPLKSFSHGSSKGRPWSNHDMAVIPYTYNDDAGEKESYCTVFCRIDRNGENYYASLRQYDRSLDKSNSDMVQAKKNMFNNLRIAFKEICALMEEQGFLDSSQYKVGGNNGGYFESEFGIFFLGVGTGVIGIQDFRDTFRSFNEYFRGKLSKM